MYNNTIGPVMMLVMCMLVMMLVMYTIKIETNRAIHKSKLIKETCVNIPVVPLEFQLDHSI